MSEANLTKSINYASKNHPHNLKVVGSNPTPATSVTGVRPGDMGDRTYL